jgi:hypothetical protein
VTTRLALLLALAALVLPAAAQAQSGDAFTPLAPAQPTQTQAPAPTTTQAQDDVGDIGRGTLFLIGGGLFALFVAIAWGITRDARQSLPEEARTEPGRRDQGPHRHAQQAKAKARAKTKAQRRARRQNR